MSNLARIRDDLNAHLATVFPVEAGTRKMSLESVDIPDPVDDLDDEDTLVRYRTEGLSYTAPINVGVKIEDTVSGKVRSAKIKLGDLPIPTSRDVSLVGGKNYVAYNQLRLSPGVYPSKNMKGVPEVMAITRRGKNFSLERAADGDMKFRVGTKGFGLYPVLRILGATHEEASDVATPIPEKAIPQVAKDMVGRLAYDPTKVPDPVAWTRDYLERITDFDEIGERNNKAVLGVAKGRTADRELILAAARRLKAIEAGKADGVDKDDLAFQEVLNPVDGLVEDLKLTLNRERYGWTKRLAKSDDPRSVIKPQAMAKAMTNYFNSSQLINHIDERNPLQTLSFRRRVTKAGEGGVTLHAKEDIRELKDSHLGFLDPVVSPESGSIGISLQMAGNARVENRRLVVDTHPVVKGRIDATKAVPVDAWQARDMVIALPDKDNYEENGSLKPLVWARVGNRMQKVDSSKVTHAFPSDARKSFDSVLGLIPFQQHNDTTRMLMGTNMLRQALDVNGKEEPLVRQVDRTTGKSLFRALGEDPAITRVVKAETDGVVAGVDEKGIHVMRRDGTVQTHRLYKNMPLNGDSFVTNTPVVKPGDRVRPGQLLAEGWYTKNGTIAPGANLKVGYMPWKGYNFEDGIVVSESLVNSGKMDSNHLVKIERLLPPDVKKGAAAGAVLKGRFGYSADRFKDMDEDGLVKPGTQVTDGDILVAAVARAKDEELSDTRRFLASLGIEQMKDVTARMPRNMKGEVVRVLKSPGPNGTTKVTIHVKATKPVAVGSKFAGFYGNKGVVTHIVPDAEMPRGADGKPLDMLLSPLGVPSRKNIGQLIELLAAKIAEKTGKPYDIEGFDQDYLQKVTNEAKRLGIEEKEFLTDPVTGKAFELPVATGKAYMLRLEHEAATTKYQARGISGPSNAETDQGVKVRAAEKTNPQSMGEMEMRALIAHGADEVLKDVSTYRSGGVRSDDAARRYFMAGLPLPDPKTPQSFKALDHYVRAAGLKIVPKSNGKPVTLDEKFQELLLVPASNKDVLGWSSGEVQNGRLLRAKDLAPDDGGLFDEKIFGRSLQEQRTRMGHIALPVPIPHPLYVDARSSINPYVQLTGLKQAQVKDLAEGALWLDEETGNLVDPAKAEELELAGKPVATSGEAFEKLLAKVDPAKVYAEATEAYKASTVPADKLKLASKAKIAKMLLDNQIAPTDLLFRNVPVIPRAFRAVTENSDGSLTYTNLNMLYKDLAEQARNHRVVGDALPTRERGQSMKALYHAYAGLVGTEDASDVTGRAGGSIVESLSGKSGLVRRRILGRSVDLSGRSAITVNPKLEMDQIGLPKQMALTLYEPFLVKNLRAKGLTPEVAAAKYGVADVDELIKRGHPVVLKALEEEVAKRAVLVNRAPTLHKYGIVATTPTLTDKSTIEMNPFILKGLGADIDGDTVAVHVPLSDKANEQAKNTMMLSKNLINPSTNTPAAEVYMEMLMGIAYATDDKQNNVPVRSFDSPEALERAIRAKDVRLHDPVTVAGKTATAGKHWVNSKVPEPYRKWDGMWTSKDVKGMLGKIIADGNYATTMATYSGLKNTGFEASTIAPVSLSASDYTPLDMKGRMKLLTEVGDPLVYTGEVRKRIAKEIGNKDVFRWMVLSGARGSADQLTHIMGTRGVATRGTGKSYDVPAIRSYADGLAFHEYAAQAHDTRRGVMMRSWKTYEPGAMTRRLWHAVSDGATISEPDCADAKGMSVRLDSQNAVLGHLLTKDVTVDGQVLAKAGSPVTPQLYTKLKGKVDSVDIRSPLTCRSPYGVCAHCYGLDLGKKDFFPVGTSVGTLAVQAFGEPMTQGVLSSFHTGTKVSAEDDDVVDSATANMIRTLSLAKPAHPAALSKLSGTVRSVDPVKRTIEVVTKEGRVLNHSYGRDVKPAVKPGEAVVAGGTLTTGKPDMLEYAEIVGPVAARPALYRAFSSAASKLGGDIPSRHIQVIAKAVTRKIRVDDPGDSPYVVGDVMDEHDAAKWNAANAGQPKVMTPDDAVGKVLAYDTGPFKAGYRLTQKDADELKRLKKTTATVKLDPISYGGAMVRTLQLPRFGSDNWFSQIAYEQVKEGLTKGSAWGMSDNLRHNKAWVALGQRRDTTN